MQNIDPDIQYALQRIGAGLDAKRVERVRFKHEQEAIAKIETMFELLADEVNVYVPRTHPAFQVVLCLAVMRKVQRQQQEPEYVPDFEKGFPSGW